MSYANKYPLGYAERATRYGASYAELSYTHPIFGGGEACHHVAAFDEYHRLRHIERKHAMLHNRTIRVSLTDVSRERWK